MSRPVSLYTGLSAFPTQTIRQEAPQSTGRERLEARQYRLPLNVSDTVGEPNAGKDQGGYDSCGDCVHFHAMAIIIVAIQAFIFFEVQDK